MTSAVCTNCGGAPNVEGLCSDCLLEVFDPRIGELVNDRYRILRKVGQGGIGRVYEANHEALGESVAIKVLLADSAKEPVARERLRREGRVLARMRHPGIVSVIDYGMTASSPFLVMEFVRGVPLSDLIRREGPPLSLLDVQTYFEQILSVLEAAHSEGIVHRDMKPENVMLVSRAGEQRHIKVLDFGLALAPTGVQGGMRLTETGSIQGTPHYMAPEQCRGAEVGPAADVYAVGCMLFEALAGVPPFDAEETAGLLAQQMFVEPKMPSSVGYKQPLSSGLEKVVARALAKQESDRMSAREFRIMLTAAFAGTDADTLMDRAAEERVRAAGLSREDRAITGVLSKVPEVEDVAGARVVLWGRETARFRKLRDAMSVAGLRTTIVDDSAPPLTVGKSAVSAVVMSAVEREGGNATRPESPSPVLVVDVPATSDAVFWIRAGANDIALDGATDGEIVRQVKRMLRRAR